jgi:hypothetical protein
LSFKIKHVCGISQILEWVLWVVLYPYNKFWTNGYTAVFHKLLIKSKSWITGFQNFPQEENFYFAIMLSLKGNVTLENIFCLLFYQAKIYYEDPKKLFHEYLQYVCSLKAHGKATKSGKMEIFLFCHYVIARTNTMAMIKYNFFLWLVYLGPLVCPRTIICQLYHL